MLNFLSLFLPYFPTPYLVSTLTYLKDERALYRNLQSSKSSFFTVISVASHTKLPSFFSSLTDRLTEWLTDSHNVTQTQSLNAKR